MLHGRNFLWWPDMINIFLLEADLAHRSVGEALHVPRWPGMGQLLCRRGLLGFILACPLAQSQKVCPLHTLLSRARFAPLAHETIACTSLRCASTPLTSALLPLGPAPGQLLVLPP